MSGQQPGTYPRLQGMKHTCEALPRCSAHLSRVYLHTVHRNTNRVCVCMSRWHTRHVPFTENPSGTFRACCPLSEDYLRDVACSRTDVVTSSNTFHMDKRAGSTPQSR